MWKATLANLRAHRLRLILTALSIVLGVAFVTGTLIFTDTLHNTFDQLFQRRLRQDQRAGAAAVTGHRPVRQQVVHPDAGCRSCRRSASLPGVAASEGSVSGFAQLVDKQDKAITTNGAPTIGASYGTVREISGFSLASGRAPHGSGQVVIDKGTADKYGFKVGDPIEILFQGPPERFTVVGIVKFGKANGLGGATVAQFDLPVAQQLLNRVGHLRRRQSAGQSRRVADHPASDGHQAPPSRLPGRHRVPAGHRRTPTRSTRASRSSPTSCWSSPWCRCSSGRSSS